MTPEEFAEKNCRCLPDYKDRNLFDPMCPCRDIEDAFREGMGEGKVEIDRLRSRIARLEKVVEAAREAVEEYGTVYDIGCIVALEDALAKLDEGEKEPK